MGPTAWLEAVWSGAAGPAKAGQPAAAAFARSPEQHETRGAGNVLTPAVLEERGCREQEHS